MASQPNHKFEKIITEQLNESASVKLQVAQACKTEIAAAAQLLIDCVVQNGKILLCGNGGSAADAQHLATELVSRLRLERKAIPALALNTNTSTLTAVSNDYDFAEIFARQVEAFGRAGDVLIGISTSGNSRNVIRALEVAGGQAMACIAFTGGDGGKMADMADIAIVVPTHEVQRIQEAHITIGHIICDLVEQSLFGN